MAQEQLLIFFDLDGTLIDVSIRHYTVYTETVKQLGGVPLDKDMYWQLKRSKTTWPELLAKSRMRPELLDEFLKIFISKIESSDYLKLDVLLPGAIEALKTASRDNVCYLISLRRNKQNLLEEVHRLGINKYFTKVLSAHSETDGSDKKTELINGELQRNGSGIIIGDTEADIKAGKSLGLTTVAVLSGIRDRTFLENLKPDYLLSDITEVVKLSILNH